MTTLSTRSELQSFAAEVRRRANAHYETPQSKRLFSVPLTLERAQLWALQNVLWSLNRRDCWAYAQALSPFDVKGMIWEHEEDELAGNKARGLDNHIVLHVRQGENLKLTPDDFKNARVRPQTRTCTYAWIHLVKDSHWLKAVSACAGLEISNSSEWVDGGGNSYRLSKRLEGELGIAYERQVSNKEHVVVDVEHAQMLMRIAEQYGTTQHALDLMLEGVIESWELETVWRGLLADMMEELPGHGTTDR